MMFTDAAAAFPLQLTKRVVDRCLLMMVKHTHTHTHTHTHSNTHTHSHTLAARNVLAH